MPIRHITQRKVIGTAVVLSLSLVLAACGTTSAHSGDHSSMNMDHNSNSDQMHNMNGVDARHGLSDNENGYRLVLDQSTFAVGQPSTLSFHVTNPDGKTQTDFAVDQTKLMHTYVIRNDTTNYQHVHPQLTNGTFSTPLTMNAAGPYRIYADFIAKDSSGKDVPLTMSSTVTVPGNYTPTALPAASNSATVDEYTITFSGEMMAGMSHDLTATITKDGQPVTDLEPYLDTFAHLTGFNTQTLAVTHLHPHNTASSRKGGPTLMFMSEFPTSGDYRLFVQFQTAGQLHTAAVTYRVS